MTEAEWLASDDPSPMVEFVQDQTSERKARLFAVACCRRIWALLPDARSRHALEVVERSVFGNPFRQAVPAKAWFTDTVVKLGATIYSENAFDRLPILADALEEAGCTNADILNHCRQPRSPSGRTNPVPFRSVPLSC